MPDTSTAGSDQDWKAESAGLSALDWLLKNRPERHTQKQIFAVSKPAILPLEDASGYSVIMALKGTGGYWFYTFEVRGEQVTLISEEQK